mmetsp:Transcript_89841/g.254581  ORF Transcript_89841/g.254581 Transcript_89841/m.254581 type:complete len:297 (+) Transcript_89841:141-1031(+)
MSGSVVLLLVLADGHRLRAAAILQIPSSSLSCVMGAFAGEGVFIARTDTTFTPISAELAKCTDSPWGGPCSAPFAAGSTSTRGLQHWAKADVGHMHPPGFLGGGFNSDVPLSSLILTTSRPAFVAEAAGVGEASSPSFAHIRFVLSSHSVNCAFTCSRINRDCKLFNASSFDSESQRCRFISRRPLGAVTPMSFFAAQRCKNGILTKSKLRTSFRSDWPSRINFAMSPAEAEPCLVPSAFRVISAELAPFSASSPAFCKSPLASTSSSLIASWASRSATMATRIPFWVQHTRTLCN